MSEWTKFSERLPEPRERCWVYGYLSDPEDKFVFDAFFEPECPRMTGHNGYKNPGWEYDVDMSNYVSQDHVTHWMPYHTPKPPQEIE